MSHGGSLLLAPENDSYLTPFLKHAALLCFQQTVLPDVYPKYLLPVVDTHQQSDLTQVHKVSMYLEIPSHPSALMLN